MEGLLSFNRSSVLMPRIKMSIAQSAVYLKRFDSASLLLRSGSLRLGITSYLSAPWVIRRRAGNLYTPVIHYLSIDEAIDCYRAHRKTLAAVRESRLWFPDVFAANRPAHDHVV